MYNACNLGLCHSGHGEFPGRLADADREDGEPEDGAGVESPAAQQAHGRLPQTLPSHTVPHWGTEGEHAHSSSMIVME